MTSFYDSTQEETPLLLSQLSIENNMSTTTRGLGQSQSNVNVGNAGDRLVNVYWGHHRLRIIILYAEMECDNTKAYFMQYCKWVADTLIPAYFDDNNLQPSRKDSSRCCSTSTLAQYVGQHLTQSQQEHPQHPDWKDLPATDRPSWWTPMPEAFVKESQHFQLTHSGDLIFRAGKIQRLYKDNNGNKPIRDDSEIKDFIQACHLKYISRNLV
jgi:hypothetical protein